MLNRVENEVKEAGGNRDRQITEPKLSAQVKEASLKRRIKTQPHHLFLSTTPMTHNAQLSVLRCSSGASLCPHAGIVPSFGKVD